MLPPEILEQARRLHDGSARRINTCLWRHFAWAALPFWSDLARDRLYISEWGHETFEAKARVNLARSLNTLRSQG